MFGKSVYVALVVYALGAVIAFLVAFLIKTMSVVINHQSKSAEKAKKSNEGGLGLAPGQQK